MAIRISHNIIGTSDARIRRLTRSAVQIIVLHLMVGCAILLPVLAEAAPANCTQIVQNINNTAATIANGADAYWGHRANFVDLVYGSLRDSPDAQQKAGQEKAQADAEKAAMPNILARFKLFVASAQSGNCVSPTQQSTIVEPTIKFAKRVNFDQFPNEVESQTSPGPPQMPMR